MTPSTLLSAPMIVVVAWLISRRAQRGLARISARSQHVAEPPPAATTLSAAERAELSSNDALQDALAPAAPNSGPTNEGEEPDRR